MSTLSQSAVPRYIQLATLFRRNIETGRWKVGEQIPTVDELASEVGVARATLRQALGILESEQLIERFRAKGTFVRRQPKDHLWCTMETNFAGLLRAREGATIEVLSAADGQLPMIVPHGIGELAPSYKRLQRRHSRDGEAFLLADVFIDERLVPRIPPEAFTSKTALKLVADVPGLVIKDAQQTLTIGGADLETAELLGVPLNAPVAFVQRTAVDEEGYIVLIADGIYRGDLVRVDIKLR
ncbi:GntR family transcriptional regulator [Bradyrhizobium sp. AUGA SZCCT0431]|uniref:GntR family transcriptional regulator n=1 Tax=Bradyrhizobium sp. AUGA SZCCT0431 TaxID=2807674 RepID=UPI001BA99769|nr:GntR family transcriptional regulator [Bradyrhizobium sp. AUGA SZCCT0431]MBR1147283.1 GntR family transcriptional regulator [Bradyrhizobium sp. AUGA SZCCT0431]